MSDDSEPAWEAAYSSSDSLWSVDPDLRIVPFLGLILRGPALDCGVGEGANAVWLAQQGFTVTGVDISETAIKRTAERARRAGVNLTLEVADLRTWTFPRSAFNLIICDTVLMFFETAESNLLIRKMIAALAPGGVVKITVLSNEEPFLATLAAGSRQIAERTYWYDKLNSPVHFYTRDEVEQLFDQLQLLSLAGERLYDVSHGDPHYHGMISYIGRRP